ncbi:MAG: hypothetical protein ACFFD4_02300 [Candidatus Odinarchaeota archaeon]
MKSIKELLEERYSDKPSEENFLGYDYFENFYATDAAIGNDMKVSLDGSSKDSWM